MHIQERYSLITQVFVYLYACRSWLWRYITLFRQVFVCLFIGKPVDISCIDVIVSNMVEAKLHINTATVEGLRKIKQVGHDRVCLLIDRHDELGDVMTIEDINKMDKPDSVKEKVFKSGLVFSLSKTFLEREQDMVGLGSLFSLMKQMSGDMGEFRTGIVKVK